MKQQEREELIRRLGRLEAIPMGIDPLLICYKSSWSGSSDGGKASKAFVIETLRKYDKSRYYWEAQEEIKRIKEELKATKKK